MKVNLTLILGVVAFAIVALMLSSSPDGPVRGPLFFFDTDPKAGPRYPRGGDA
jgi:hypothetical protein